MQLSASAVGINQLSARELQLLRGEVEFSGLGSGGHRAKYIIAPPEMESADEILRLMWPRWMVLEASKSFTVLPWRKGSLCELGQFTNTPKPRGLGDGHWRHGGLAVQTEVHQPTVRDLIRCWPSCDGMWGMV